MPETPAQYMHDGEPVFRAQTDTVAFVRRHEKIEA